jgi:60 kDa SS-A/Ro ribonucleoprotein
VANLGLFKTERGLLMPHTDTLNEAGGNAYSFSDKHKLAQFCMTGCFSDTYYIEAKTQLSDLIEVCKNLDEEFIAKCAIYCREKGYMKDTPAFLVALLAVKGYKHWEVVFRTVIDNVKMLRNFFQIIRSGVLERKSFGSRIKKEIKLWLNNASDRVLIKGYIGHSPTLSDIIACTHPKAKDDKRNELFKFIRKKENINAALLPEDLQKYIEFKSRSMEDVVFQDSLFPDVPFQMLSSLNLAPSHWRMIAKNAPWQMTRMNINTFNRHEVFKDKEMVSVIANRLRDKPTILKSRAYPYQLLTAFHSIAEETPYEIKEALQDAMEASLDNVPEIPGSVLVGIDVSGSMNYEITGRRKVSTKTRCVDVAAMIGAAILRKNVKSLVVPFSDTISELRVNPRDSIATNAKRMADICGGGTDFSLIPRLILKMKWIIDTVIIVSDNQSWIDKNETYYGTKTVEAWNIIKKYNPKAKLICIDLTPTNHTQAFEREDIINIGGFSDNTFDLIARIANGTNNKDLFVKEIEKEKII